MVVKPKDFVTDSLLALNGDRYFIDDKGDFEVIFKVISVAVTPERPHGLKYTLVLIDAKGERVICFDNAHAVSLGPGPGKKLSRLYDHKHIGNKVFPYTFEDAYSLVADFWKEVDKLEF
jgi:hypothetical protein